LWAVGAKKAPGGGVVVDPKSDFTLPLAGEYFGNNFSLADQNFNMAITGIPIPFNRFELRGALGQDGKVQPGASVYADAQALSIPTFGPYLVAAGLANNMYEKLLVDGTYVTRAYLPSGKDVVAANRHPAGIDVTKLNFTAPEAGKDGEVTARFGFRSGVQYLVSDHNVGILLVDADQTTPVFLDYHALLSTTADKLGNLVTVTLKLPAGTQLPAHLRAYVMLDVFPVGVKDIR
jgi:hypothetical protein